MKWTRSVPFRGDVVAVGPSDGDVVAVGVVVPVSVPGVSVTPAPEQPAMTTVMRRIPTARWRDFTTRLLSNGNKSLPTNERLSMYVRYSKIYHDERGLL